MSRYVSAAERQTSYLAARDRMLAIQSLLNAKLFEQGVTTVPYYRLQIWGDKVVEFRSDAGGLTFCTREKKTKTGQYVFDLDAVVEYLVKIDQRAKDRAEWEAQQKTKKQVQHQQFSETIYPAFKTLAQDLSPETLKRLNLTTNTCYSDNDCLEFTVKFRASTPEQAAQEVELLKKFVEVFRV